MAEDIPHDITLMKRGLNFQFVGGISQGKLSEHVGLVDVSQILAEGLPKTLACVSPQARQSPGGWSCRLEDGLFLFLGRAGSHNVASEI